MKPLSNQVLRIARKDYDKPQTDKNIFWLNVWRREARFQFNYSAAPQKPAEIPEPAKKLIKKRTPKR